MGPEQKRRRILIIEQDPEMCALLGVVLGNPELLDGVSYEIEECIVTGEMRGLVERVKSTRPDLLIVDVSERGEAEHYGLLDALRADAATGSIPIVALTPHERLSHMTTASYNVKAAVTKPFDLDDLARAIRETLGEPALPSALPPAAAQAEDTGFRETAHRLLAERSREAVFNWIQRLQRERPWALRRGLDLRGLIDHVPPIVEAVAASILEGEPDDFLRRHPEIAERARKHAEWRSGQGIALADVIREYTLLRNEILAIFRCCLPRQVTVDDVLALNEAVNLTLDEIIEVTVASYTAARVTSDKAI